LVGVGQLGDFHLHAKLYFLDDNLDPWIAEGSPIDTQGARQSVQPSSREGATQKIQAQFREAVEKIGSVAGSEPSPLVSVGFYLLSAQYRRERCGRRELGRVPRGRRQLRPQVLGEVRCLQGSSGRFATACFRPSGAVDRWRVHFYTELG
jgi:hypothetical protein